MKKQWKFAALKTKELPDPWVGFGFDKIKEEIATRHMYNPRSGKWKTDKITIKMQSEVRQEGREGERERKRERERERERGREGDGVEGETDRDYYLHLSSE